MKTLLLKLRRAMWRRKYWSSPTFVVPPYKDARETTLGYMPKSLSGFSLLELMIAVAIVGILSAVAIPAYLSYEHKAQVSESLGMAAADETAVADFIGQQGTAPSSDSEAGVSPQNGRYVQVVDVDSLGVVSITFAAGADASFAGKTLNFTPYKTSLGNVVWVCGYASAPAGAVAYTDDGAGAAATPTNIDPSLLPAACHAGA